MSRRQKNITLTKPQQRYVKSHSDESVDSIAKRFGISSAKVSTNLMLMGLDREGKVYKKPKWENNGFFDESEFGRLPIP